MLHRGGFRGVQGDSAPQVHHKSDSGKFYPGHQAQGFLQGNASTKGDKGSKLLATILDSEVEDTEKDKYTGRISEPNPEESYCWREKVRSVFPKHTLLWSFIRPLWKVLRRFPTVEGPNAGAKMRMLTVADGTNTADTFALNKNQKVRSSQTKSRLKKV